MEKLRSRLTYANVMATIAVFVALGGSSYAALRVTSKDVPKDALSGADIKNLTGTDVRNNSLTGADVKGLTSADIANGRLLAEDFGPGQLPRGQQGETGATGATGAPGSALAYAHVRGSTPTPVQEDNSKGVTDAQVTIANGSICFYNLGFDPKSVTANIENAGLDYRLLRVRSNADTADTDCAGSEDASVTLLNGDLSRHTEVVNAHVVFN